MKNLLLSSIFLLLLGACHPGHYGRLNKTPVDSLDYLKRPKPIFGDNFNSFLFKTNIRVYGHDFSGLLITKQVSPKDYRAIFTTELGMKLFDFEFHDTTFTLHYCVPQFNRPKLLQVIRKDIELLLMNNIEYTVYDHYYSDPRTSVVFRSAEGNRFNYYFFEDQTANLVEIEQSSKRAKKVIFTLSEHKDGFPGHILIQHYDMKLKIELNLLKK